MRQLLILCMLHLVFSKNIDKRIIGGIVAESGEYPFMAQVLINGHFKCGANIIHSNWALTAAHCFKHQYSNQGTCKLLTGDEHEFLGGKYRTKRSYYPEEMQPHSEAYIEVVLGTNMNPPDARSVRIASEKVVFYDNPNHEENSDIALIKLKYPAPLTSNSNMCPICLTSSDYFPKSAMIAGWGLTSTTGDLSHVLKKGLMDIVNSDECVREMGDCFNQHSEICAKRTYNQFSGYPNLGDSGGPIFFSDYTNSNCQHTLLGVCAKINLAYTYASYVKVANYLDWIETTMGNDKPCYR